MAYRDAHFLFHVGLQRVSAAFHNNLHNKASAMIEGKLNGIVAQMADIERIMAEACADVFSGKSDECVEQVRRQLMEGLSGSGEPLRPTYTEDPYFSSPQQAEAYVTMKKERFGVDCPPNGSPNMYINGHFHNSLHMEVHDSECSVESTASFADEIWAKFGKENFGISDKFFAEEIKPLIISTIKQNILA